MESSNPGEPVPQPRRSVRQILKSYFYWTYPRGCFHYDVMVTLILLFIFVTPHICGAMATSRPAAPDRPIRSRSSATTATGSSSPCRHRTPTSPPAPRTRSSSRPSARPSSRSPATPSLSPMGNRHRRPGKSCLEGLGPPVTRFCCFILRAGASKRIRNPMHLGIKLVFAASIALAFARPAASMPPRKTT